MFPPPHPPPPSRADVYAAPIDEDEGPWVSPDAPAAPRDDRRCSASADGENSEAYRMCRDRHQASERAVERTWPAEERAVEGTWPWWDATWWDVAAAEREATKAREVAEAKAAAIREKDDKIWAAAPRWDGWVSPDAPAAPMDDGWWRCDGWVSPDAPPAPRDQAPAAPTHDAPAAPRDQAPIAPINEAPPPPPACPWRTAPINQVDWQWRVQRKRLPGPFVECQAPPASTSKRARVSELQLDPEELGPEEQETEEETIRKSLEGLELQEPQQDEPWLQVQGAGSSWGGVASASVASRDACGGRTASSRARGADASASSEIEASGWRFVHNREFKCQGCKFKCNTDGDKFAGFCCLRCAWEQRHPKKTARHGPQCERTDGSHLPDRPGPILFPRRSKV